MEESYITAGEFAKLARTTKRTITFYDEKGLLKPMYVNEKGYRYYKTDQILDFQVISLLIHLNFSLDEVISYLHKSNTLENLFYEKRGYIEKEIGALQLSLQALDEYYKNLKETGCVIAPEIKTTSAFAYYYIEKTGAYSDIYTFGLELKSMFASIPQDAIYLSVFQTDGYQPQSSDMRIGVMKTNDMTLKSNIEEMDEDIMPSLKVLHHTYKGPAKMLSLQWKFLEEYAIQHKIILNVQLPTFELYIKTGFNDIADENQYIFELFMPIT